MLTFCNNKCQGISKGLEKGKNLPRYVARASKKRDHGDDDIPPSKKDYSIDRIPYIKKYKNAAYAETAVNVLEQIVNTGYNYMSTDTLIDVIRLICNGSLYPVDFIEGTNKAGGGTLQISIDQAIDESEARVNYKKVVDYFNKKHIAHVVMPILKTIEIDLNNMGTHNYVMIPINWSNEAIQIEWDL
jgi:hypothetical protein